MKIILITLGTISLILGIIGIFLPLLPTTPFILLSSICYAKSSDRFYSWLINHPRLGSYIHKYRVKRTIPLKAKVASISMLWSTFILNSVFLLAGRWMIIGIYLLVCIGVTWHLLSFKSE